MIPGILAILAIIYKVYIFAIIYILLGFAAFFGSWLAVYIRKSDFIQLNTGGISYYTSSEEGYLPWDTLREIRRSKQGYVLQSTSKRLVIGLDLEPVASERISIIQRFRSSRRPAQDLINHILQIAPHVYYRESFLERDIFRP
jgi:hypothetical protein